MIDSTQDKHDNGATPSKQKRTVTTHRVSGGFICNDREPKVVNPQVHWAGAGSYWHWTSLDNIESNRSFKNDKSI